MPSFLREDVYKLVRQIFSSFFYISSISLETLGLAGLTSHSVTLNQTLLLLRNIRKCVKYRRSHLKLCNFYGKLGWYVPLSNIIPSFVVFLAVTGTALSTISYIFSIDSLPSLLFSSIFCRSNLASRKDLCCSTFASFNSIYGQMQV